MSRLRWLPGTVATATVQGVKGVRVMRIAHVPYDYWCGESFGGAAFADDAVSDVRPLVVLDPEDREQVERLARLLDARPDDIAGVLREFANPTPPKPAEPQGLGAVVEDAEGLTWLRHRPADYDYSCPWVRVGAMDVLRKYADLTAVRVLSEGVTTC